MLTQTMWWSGNALMACLLVRAIKGGFFRKYFVFYIYIAHALVFALVRFSFYTFQPSAFRNVYWYTQFVSVAVGCCVIWEIYQQALAAYPGTLRMARRLVLAILLVVAAKGLSNSLTGPVWGAAKTVFDLERELRTVQAALLLIIFGVLSYYMIPIGRNLRGIISGYGFFLGTNVVNATLLSYMGDTFQIWWSYFQSVAYGIALMIWTATLWSYHPNPLPETEIEIEHDYELLSSRTAQAIARARGYLLRSVRS